MHKTLLKLQKDGKASCRQITLPCDLKRLCGVRVDGVLQLGVLQTWWLLPTSEGALASGSWSSPEREGEGEHAGGGSTRLLVLSVAAGGLAVAGLALAARSHAR